MLQIFSIIAHVMTINEKQGSPEDQNGEKLLDVDLPADKREPPTRVGVSNQTISILRAERKWRKWNSQICVLQRKEPRIETMGWKSSVQISLVVYCPTYWAIMD
ncbi:hypothetical protein AVEN_229743-1 [Araneus ventricosus]|uniref:Uncharacterized protein n=1 Tax=Araneus ventricosus TaxID=182803 RepID=A0A4Y2ESB0_ARAVE|nr:hypothetical protein AVEN_229743-1 [Araneus ventricosus]